MKQVPVSIYEVLQFGLGGDSWQQFVDRYEEKYNALTIDGFEFAPTKINYTFSQLIGSLGVKTLPAYVDPESPGYEKALKSIQGVSGNIPTQKAFYSLDRVTVLEKLQLIDKFGMEALTPEMQNVFLGMLDEGTDGLIGGYYNSLSHQRMRVVSTGKCVIDATNNPRGLRGITLDFGIDASHFDTLKTTARWWTAEDHTLANEGSASDPIEYLKAKAKEIRKKYHAVIPMHIEISDNLWSDMLGHSKVLARIGYSQNVLIADNTTAVNAGKNLDDIAKKAIIERIVGLPIVVRDSVAYVDKPDADSHSLLTVAIPNFDEKNVAFVPDGKIGDIQGVQPLTLGYEPDKVARYDGGRLVLTQRANAEAHSIYIESEAAQLCVPSVPQFMFISTVTA